MVNLLILNCSVSDVYFAIHSRTGIVFGENVQNKLASVKVGGSVSKETVALRR